MNNIKPFVNQLVHYGSATAACRQVLPVLYNFSTHKYQTTDSSDNPKPESKLAQLKKKLHDGPEFGEFVSSKNNEELAQKYSEQGIKLKRVKGERLRLPPWLKTDIPKGKNYAQLKDTLRDLKLSTVCEEAK